MYKNCLLLLLCGGAAWAQPTWTVDSPKFPLIAPAQQWIEFEAHGPVGAAPVVSGGTSQWRLQEVRPGVYRGRIQAVDADLKIENQVVGNCLTDSKSLGVFEVTRQPAVFRAGPSSDFDRLTPVDAGVRFQIMQRQGDYLQVSPPLGWIRSAEGKILPPETSLGGSQLQGVHIDASGRMRLRLGARCAYQVHPDPERRQLVLDLPGTPMAMHEMAYAQIPAKSKDGRRPRINSVRLRPENWGTRLEIPLGERYWGYSTRWQDGDLWFTPSTPPRIDPRRPLHGLTVTVDAGHGGEDSGTVGLELKKKEKDLNLAVSRSLRLELEKAGAKVVMTRDSDREVAPDGSPADYELQSRVDVAERSGSHLFISIHHNARADIRHGRVSHGTHIYYYQPQSRGLAQEIAEPLASAIGEPSWMHFWRSFAVTRQTSMPSVLVEANFLSNPKLERGMLGRADYPQRCARGVRIGVERFLRHKY